MPCTQHVRRAGLTEEQWQRSVGSRGLDPDVAFAFGLKCVLDGLAARLGR